MIGLIDENLGLVIIALVGSLFTFFGTCVASRYAYLAKKNAKEVNQAVNCRPTGDPTIYTMVARNTQSLLLIRETLEEIKDRIETLENKDER